MPLSRPATDATLVTSDITTNDASASKHGFLKKLSGVATEAMGGDGNWFTPAGTGAVATDSIWDAAGDLAVGTGANTAAKLTLGAAGGAVSRVNGAVAWNSGTSFPTAATGDRYWRTDHGREYYYDGTRWLSTQEFVIQMIDKASASPGASAGLNATTATAVVSAVPIHSGASDVYLTSHWIDYYVNGGTALSGSHKWVGTLDKYDTSNAATTIVTDTIDSGSSSVWRRTTDTINALLTQATYFRFTASWTKTGTPGDLVVYHAFAYRIVAT